MGTAAPVALALGTVQFGLAYGVVGSGRPVDDDETRRILAHAAASGVQVLDTAAAYGDIEQRLAGLAGAHPFTVVTKIAPLPEGLSAVGAADFVRQAIERSQARLGTLLRAVLFHSADNLMGPLGDVLWASASALTVPLGLKLGVSCYGPAQLEQVAQRYPVAIAQLPGNALDQRLNGYRFPRIELHLRSAFLQGLLLAPAEQGGQRVPAAAAALQRWHQTCAVRGLTPLAAALGMAKGLAGVRQVVVGVERVAQFDEIAAAWQAAQPLSVPELATEDPAIIDPRVWRTA